MHRLAFSTALACLLAAACGDSDAPGSPDAARPDAAPRADARPPADAAAEPDAAARPDAIIHLLGESLHIAVAEKFQPDNPCFPEPDIASITIVLPVTEASAGQTVDIGGGSAHLCPPEDSGDSCDNHDSGSVTFDRYEAEVGAAGRFDIGGGAATGSFDALWCE